MQHLSCWYIVSFFSFLKDFSFTFNIFYYRKQQLYDDYSFILIVVVVVVVVVVQRLKMAVFSSNLRNAISFNKKKSDNFSTTISGNINTLCLLSNSRTTISVCSPIKTRCEEKRTIDIWYVDRALYRMSILFRVCVCVCVRSIKRKRDAIHIYTYIHIFFTILFFPKKS